MFEGIEKSIQILTSKPLFLLYGDAVAFGPIKCDPGSKSGMLIPPHMFKGLPLTRWWEQRSPCPGNYTCQDEIIKPGKSICVNSKGEENWHLPTSYTRVWKKEFLVGKYINKKAPEYMSLSHPGVIADAVESVQESK
jgi:hypothetical protein